MPEIWVDVDVAVTLPVNIMPLIDDTDFKSREVGIVYNQAGMDLVWNFQTAAGVTSQTSVTPTTAGDYDWAHSGDAMYNIEMTASGGASINNDTEGFGWFSGICTGVLAWRGPIIGFRAAAVNDALVDGGDVLDINLMEMGGVVQSATDLKDFADAGYDPATNKVEGVKVVDTNSDMRGTDGANTVVPDVAGFLPTAIENRVEMDTNSVDLNTLITGQSDIKGATFATGTDSLEAIRNRGDVAWITGGGGGITDILNIQALIPISVDLADTATFRLGLMLINSLDDLPSTAEIDPGTISIDRKAIGGTSWSAIVTDVACSESAGLIYYDEVFDSGTGYAEGDTIRITLKSQKITVTANDYEISDATGRIFYTFIRQTMRGTDGANTVVPDVAGFLPTAIENRVEMDANSVDLNFLITQIGVAGAGLLDLGGMSTAMKAEILVEVNAALDTAIAELGVGVPSATPSVRTGLMLMYMALRNKLDVQTSGTDSLEVHNNAGTLIAQKLLTDAAGDYSEAKMT